MQHNILDEVPPSQTGGELRKQKRQTKILAWIFAGMVLFNGVFYALIDPLPMPYQILSVFGSIIGSFLYAVVPAFFLAVLFAFIPYEKYSYRRKFTNIFLISGILFSCIVMLAFFS